MTDMLPSAVLEAAADLLTPAGMWTQGAFGKNDLGYSEEDWSSEDDEDDAFVPTCFCVYGAIHLASGEAYDADSGGKEEAYLPYLKRAVGLEEHAPPCRVSDWNDEEGRTQAEVVQALRDAAALARSEGR